ncbi:MAG: PP2C family protein-serine/threonine phosphatase, partial [Cephaloticoccus sp.]
MIHFRAAALTDIGRVRRRNEDRLLLDEPNLIFGVADGVGGLPGGAEAAELVLNSVGDALKTAQDGPPDLKAIVRRANREVHRLGQELSPSTGIGSTLTIGQVRDRELVIGHVGDSKCYALRGGNFSCLTTDHSVENEMLARRARGEEVYFLEANRHALTRCMGQPGD